MIYYCIQHEKFSLNIHAQNYHDFFSPTLGYVYFVKIFVITPVVGYFFGVITIELCKCFYNDYLSEMVSVGRS